MISAEISISMMLLIFRVLFNIGAGSTYSSAETRQSNLYVASCPPFPLVSHLYHLALINLIFLLLWSMSMLVFISTIVMRCYAL